MKKIGLVMLLVTTFLMAKAPSVYTSKCVVCHGKSGEKNTMKPVAIPNTLKKAELITALKGYRAGTLNKFGLGIIMKGPMHGITDDQINEIANYISKK